MPFFGPRGSKFLGQGSLLSGMWMVVDGVVCVLRIACKRGSCGWSTSAYEIDVVVVVVVAGF